MSVVSKDKLLKKLSKKDYRDAYAEESVKTSLPFQLKVMREQRNWSQIILGKKSGMKQNAVSRLESAEYGNLNINTLLRLANAFDCALLVKFVPFSKLVREFEDKSPSGLEVDNFDKDLKNLEQWQNEKSRINEKIDTLTSKDLIKTFLFTLDVLEARPVYINTPSEEFANFSFNTPQKSDSFVGNYIQTKGATSVALCDSV